MASNVFSKLLPSVSDDNVDQGESQRNERQALGSSHNDPEHNIDEANLGEHFQDQDLDQLLDDGAHSEIAAEHTAFVHDNPDEAHALRSSAPRSSRPRWMNKQPVSSSKVDEDDDVPESLLLEPGTRGPKASKDRTRRKARVHEGRAPLRPANARDNHNMRPHLGRVPEPPGSYRDAGLNGHESHPPVRKTIMQITDPKARAMWRWANVQNLDQFLSEVYDYYDEKGIWSILLRRAISLASVTFVVVFVTFLTMCIDYSNIHNSQKLGQIVVPQCAKKMPGIYSFFLWLFAVSCIFTLFQNIISIPRLWEMHNFYHHLLGIPDADIQTVSWQTVVGKLMALRDANATTALNLTEANRRFISTQSKQRMDAHDIANRLMRKENYMIALVNKDYFDTTVPIPFLGEQQFWTRSIEWNIALCLMDFVFEEEGHIRPDFLTSAKRRQLIATLRHRFAVAAIINIFFAPFLFVYYTLSYFFQYFAEYHRNPGELGSRTFTPLAEWKFREFNELRHIFLRRKNLAFPYATRYLDQFPKDKVTQVCRFVSFVAGALAAVLGVASLLAPELFLGFEILPGQTVLFWLGILGGIYAAARAQVPEEEHVSEPQYALLNVIECTRYCPTSWEGRLHSDEVRREFSSLYKQKIVVFVEEALSMIFTPYVLLVSLPRCADRLIDFFREFTMHVDGLGHVCSFAVFDFTRTGKNVAATAGVPPGKDAELREDHFATKDNKMLASYMGFMDLYANNNTRGSKSKNSRLFPLPPAFPILPSMLGSPVQTNEFGQSAGRHSVMLGMGGARTFQSMHGGELGTAAQNRLGGTRSPVQSVLLDPHHQPGTARHGRSAAVHSPHRSARPGQSRYGGHARAEADGPGDGPVTASRIMEEDSMLGDSWRTDHAAEMDEGEGEVASKKQGADDAGVLGMLLNFQRAHAESRGVGI